MRRLAHFAILLAISPLLTACGQTPPAAELSEAVADHPPPDFRLATLDGGEIGPLDYEGEAVVLDFWATWCGPCRLQAEYLEELHEELDGKNVQFLAVNVGETAEQVQDFVAETPFPYPVLLDSKDTLTSRYNLLGLPTVMVVDTQGKISFLRTGVTDNKTLREALRDAGADV